MDLKFKKIKGKPNVVLSVEDKIFEISGDSYLPNVVFIYDQILEWIDKEIDKLSDKLICKFHFSVINTISKKKMMQIVFNLNKNWEKGKDLEIIWIYDKSDEDSLMIAEDIIELFDIPIKKIELL